MAAPDLTIAKTHVGNFGPGQVGATYTITVTNMGSAPTAGTVTVTDTLPGGLTATALAGTGWTCALATMTCARAAALAGGASYQVITLTVDVSAAAPPSVTNTATVSGGGDVNPAHGTATDVTTISASFVDVPGTDPLFSWIEALVAAGLTDGCGTAPPMFCPDAVVSRGQIAVFLLRGIHGAGFSPPPATGVFADVPLGHPFVRWIEQVASEDITSGCATGPARYCPDAVITREQMAVFLVRTFNLPI